MELKMLQLVHVKKKYHKNIVIDDLSFEIEQGEIFGLLGVNGAGKSTTISMIGTILKPDQGDILYNGESVVKNPSGIRKDLGYVPQEVGLYPFLTGYDNLKFWGKAYGLPNRLLSNRIEEVASVIGFTKDMLKKQVKTYSGGMKQRLNIGVALLHDPKIIIMDEPTVGIDLIGRNQILDLVMSFKRSGVTVIYCSHHMEEVEKICDKICILDKGKTIACGNKDSLLQNEKGKRTLEQLYMELLS